ncbi:hypothetical protein ID866_10432 [Astraeus odoratus]|nr:hypothetical protein ID866_10432 [Astraeus odoratus]
MIDPSKKIPFNASSATNILLPTLVLYFTTAFLAIRPGTVVWRRLLLPLTLWFAFQTGTFLDVSGGDPARAHANQSLALFMFMISMRCISWAACSKHVQPVPGSLAEANARKTSWGALFSNVCDLALGLRELAWQDSSRPKILPNQLSKCQKRSTFLTHRAFSASLHLVLGDMFQTILHSFSPELATPEGGSVFDPSSPPLRRYLRSTTMSFLLGSMIYLTTHAIYDFISFLGVLVFQQCPSRWPPLFHRPWLATSLRELWGRRWHHLNRNWLISLGAKPAYRLFGPAGGVLCAFALSGMMHDVGLRAVGRGSDFMAVFGFFFMMGVGVILELAWATAYGSAPSGVIGWLWTFGWVALWGNRLADAWLLRGAAAAAVIPEQYRPSKLVWMITRQTVV